MTSENTPEETAIKNRGITEEQYRLALEAGYELSKITITLEELENAHRVGYPDMALTPRKFKMSALYEVLIKKRKELRAMLLDIK